MISVVLPVMDQLEETRHVVALLCHMTVGDFELVIVDNGSGPETRRYYERFIAPRVPRFQYVRNERNVGVIPALQQGYRHSTGDIVAFMHNDLFLYEHGWNIRIQHYFDAIPGLGLAGFFGCKGLSHDGSRVHCMSNMDEAAHYGGRPVRGEWEPVVVLDGYSLICRRAMLDRVGGFDPGYLYHHYYDYDLSLASLANGFRNIVVNVPCAHPGGFTSWGQGYQAWIHAAMGVPGADGLLYQQNLNRFRNKWRHWLPIYVLPDFRLTRRPVPW